MDDIRVRRVAPHEAHACIEGLADVLGDCVERRRRSTTFFCKHL
jgi:hypothetical protein